MAERARQNILKRKAIAGRESAPVSRVVLPAKALSTALIKAADSMMGMAVASHSVSERIASLPDLLEQLPENGLLAVLEGPGECQGLMAFDSAAISAVIEKQMTGAISDGVPQPRRVTRTDAALCADLIDATLHRFEATLAGREESRWAGGFGYASHVEDLRPLGLLLEEIDYRIFGLKLDFELGRRDGQVLLALPAEGRGVILEAETDDHDDMADQDPDWAPQLEKLVLQGEVQLDAVLHRIRLPISAIGDFKVGDEIPIPLSAIDNVRFRGAERIPLGRCRLGSSQGKRAVRLGTEAVDGAAQLAAVPKPRTSAPLGAQAGDGLPELPTPGLPDLSAAEPELPALPDLPELPDLPDLSGGDLPDIGATPMAIGTLGGDGGLPDLG